MAAYLSYEYVKKKPKVNSVTPRRRAKLTSKQMFETTTNTEYEFNANNPNFDKA